MRDVTVIADDLTGAADCGIAFSVAGLPAFVSFADAAAPPSARVVSVDIDSRWRPVTDAAGRARAATQKAQREGSRALYKKIDSTLRGHVGAELAAMSRAVAEHAGGRTPLLIVAPAFPATGRTTRGGCVFVGTEPLGASEVWRKSGMTGAAELVPMLEAAGLRAAVVEPARLGADERIDAAVCDAENEDDLRRIAEAGARVGRQVIWVGSAGLARHLPAALALRSEKRERERTVERASARILTLVGSRSTLAREQARLLAEEQGVGTLVLDESMLLAGVGSEAWSRAAEALQSLLARGEDPLLIIGLGAKVELEHAPVLASAIARLAAAQAGRLGGLVATGGDIARAALDALGASGLYLVGEVEPGVPLGFTDTQPPLPVVTKAGAFGTPAALQRSRAALQRLITMPTAGASTGEWSQP
jgi:uncharacterized protein YgbK (DUF1537 family)